MAYVVFPVLSLGISMLSGLIEGVVRGGRS
jgi:hypothetical protein